MNLSGGSIRLDVSTSDGRRIGSEITRGEKKLEDGSEWIEKFGICFLLSGRVNIRNNSMSLANFSLNCLTVG